MSECTPEIGMLILMSPERIGSLESWRAARSWHDADALTRRSQKRDALRIGATGASHVEVAASSEAEVKAAGAAAARRPRARRRYRY